MAMVGAPLKTNQNASFSRTSYHTFGLWASARFQPRCLMPKDLAKKTPYLPVYLTQSQRLYERLGKAKAAASAYQVIAALQAYAMNSGKCWPAHSTIQKWCGGEEAISLRSIERACKWLEDNLFLKRYHHRSKPRFLLYIDEPRKEEPEKVVSQPCRDELKVVSQPCRHNMINLEHDKKPPLLSPPQAEENKTQKPKKRKEYNRKWRSKEERRAAKAERAAARAERQRAEQREAKRTNPLERQKRLRNALDWIALRMPVECLMEGDKEHLQPFLDEWISGLSEQRRKLFKIESDKTFRREMIRRIGEM